MKLERQGTIPILGAIALSIGTAIGWGTFIVPGSTFLNDSGIVGSIIGLVVGFIVMLIFAHCYSFMMNKNPNTNGGIFYYAKKVLNGDHAFLVSWFLLIIYFSMFLGNASSIPFHARYILGDSFQYGFHYQIGGYDIYFGEILLSSIFILIFGGICLLNKSVSIKVEIGLVFSFVFLILMFFFTSITHHEGGTSTYEPAFAENGIHPFIQVISSVSVMPWAFIGFESVIHSSKDYKFKHKHILKVFYISLIAVVFIYIAICFVSISAIPEGYSNWHEYIHASNTQQGILQVPAFYVINHFMGKPGIFFAAFALICIIITSIIGNIYALSNLVCEMAKEGFLPKIFQVQDKNGNARNAILFFMSLGIALLFLGKVLVGWIVDITTFSGIIVYSYIAIICYRQSRKDDNKRHEILGIIGISMGILFFATLVLNSLFNEGYLEMESILMLIIWATIGFAYYGISLRKDKVNRLGNSMVALFGLFLLIIYAIGSWLLKLVKLSNSNYVIVGIVFSMILLIATQTVFFYAFSIIKKREVDMQDKLILGMAIMIEGRDNSTGGHIKRTSVAVRFLVEEMKKDEALGIDNSFYLNIIKAAPMHDLGKITIDDVILRKPGKFTPEEYEIMKTHSREGGRIINEVLADIGDKQYLEIALNIARYHHERWDGSGYPLGLKEEEIPLEARIMAIADVYDALVSKRVYKEKFSFEDADKIIREGMGSQFDPNLEKYYVKALPKIEAYYKED